MEKLKMKKVTIIVTLLVINTLAIGQEKTNQEVMKNTIKIDHDLLEKKEIKSEFQFKSRFVDVNKSNIHYVDEGKADSEFTFLMIHGNPTSSYIWRNIIPYLSQEGRVVAVDLIGMGKSDKPDIGYTFEDHIDYVDGFIQELGLKNIILVIQDWGSGIGFNYAYRNSENVKGIVFFEAITRTVEWNEANFIERILFKRFRDEKKGHKMIVEKNFFVKKFLPLMTKRKLKKEEKEYYAEPYLNEEDRTALRVWPTQIPISGEPESSYSIVKAYEKWLPSSQIPKLMFHAKPGMIIKPKEASKIASSWENLDVVDLGKGKHYLQETYPHQMGTAIKLWFENHFQQ